MSNRLRLKKWIDASKILEEKNDAEVKCPNCNIGKLKIIDTYMSDSEKVDRYITCPNCKETFLITQAVKGEM